MSHNDRDEITTGRFVDASHKGYFKNCKFSDRMLLNIKFKMVYKGAAMVLRSVWG